PRRLPKRRACHGNQTLEEEDVDLNACWLEGHGIVDPAERPRLDGGQRSAEAVELLAETCTRLPLRPITPEQGCELIPGKRPTCGTGEIGQECPRLATRES